MGLCGSQKQKTVTKIDPGIKQRVDGLLGQMDSQMSKPYTPYTGQLVAGSNADIDQSYALTRDFANRYSQPLDVAAMLRDPATIQSYMNPFQQGVIDTGLGELGRQGQIMQKGVDSSATSAGAFGDARHGIAQAETNRGVADMMQKFLGEQLNAGYDKATGLISSLPGLTATQQGIEQKAISGLNAAGLQQQGQTQAELTSQYEQWLKQQGFPEEQIKFFAQILAMLPGGQTQTSTQSGGGLSQLLGGLTSIAGSYLGSPSGSAQMAAMI